MGITALSLLALTLIYPYRLVRNLFYAWRTNLPYVVIPFDQDATIWVILSVPCRPLIKKWLPSTIAERILITIWGWEFHEGNKPFDKWARPMGDRKTVAFVTCGNFEVNTWDAELVSEILRRPKDFHEPSFNEAFLSRFGSNVLTSNGEHWARQRRIMAQVINERISKVVFNETVHQTAGLLDEVMEDDKKSSAETYGAFDMMKKLTIHVLSGATLGRKVSWRDDDHEPSEAHKMTFMDACKVVMDAMAGPILLPSWFLDNYPAFLPGSQYVKRLGLAVRVYPAHTRVMFETERQRLKQPGNGVTSDVVSQMVYASEGLKAGVGLTEDEMTGNLFIFTAAGFDTTANTLSYALAVLVQNPKWQTWIFEEIDEILPRDKTEELDYATVFPKATRIMAAMLEVLRLYSPLVHISKATYGEQTIRTSKHTYRLPRNANVYVNSISLHQDADIWRGLNSTKEDIIDATMPDESIFRPTRWINSDGKLFQPPRGAYVPWSMGPRVCPGMKMAQVEFTGTLLTLFRSHRIDAVPLQIATTGSPGPGVREETPAEVSQRIADRLRDSLSLLTLQMNGVYDASKAGAESQGIKLRFSRR